MIGNRGNADELIRRGSGIVWLAVLLSSVWLGLNSADRTAASRLEQPPWLPESTLFYQGKAPAASSPSVRLLVVGDINLGRDISEQEGVFAHVSAKIAAADLAAGNLESAISIAPIIQQPGSALTGYPLLAPPKALTLLQRAGFDVISVANNHVLDGGETARWGAISGMERAGLTPIGTTPGAVQVLSARGVRLAFLAFNAVAVPGHADLTWDRGAAIEAVRSAAQRADAVVVLMHWGSEYELQASPRQREAARDLARAGADLIVGSHPHVVQGSEVIVGANGRRSFVAYSLGNFVFDQHESPETQTGAVLEVQFTPQGLLAVGGLSVNAARKPSWLVGTPGKAQRERMAPSAQAVEIRCDFRTCYTSTSASARKPPTVAGTGWADLSGDGRDERVTLRSHRIVIADGEKDVWQSPPEWDVHDFVLGDPNDDGRFEILLALEKVDAGGALVSHPFIIGYRGGCYRQVWGGSAVADPIKEVALGDVDGDGKQEMVVLEERCGSFVLQESDGACTRNVISVWRWNGWGFTQFWRSEAAHYQHLEIIPGEKSASMILVSRLW